MRCGVIFVTTLHDGFSKVNFRYDPVVVEVLKSTTVVHRWDAGRRYRRIETNRSDLLARKLVEQGYEVLVDNRPWVPVTTPLAASPIVALFNALPAYLRRPTYLALSKVLHPDRGGNTALMQQLNAAIEDDWS